MSEFKIPSSLQGRVVHARPNLICFLYRGRKIDLRSLTEDQMLAYAAKPDFPVLQLVNSKPKTEEPPRGDVKADPGADKKPKK